MRAPTRRSRLAGLLLTCAALAGPAAGHLSAQERRPVEIEDMFLMRNVGAPVVSPDGAWVAYTVSRTSLEDQRSYTRIYMVPSGGGEPVALTAEGKSASSPAWSPDGRLITFSAGRDGGEAQVWALDRRGGEAYPLTHVEQGIDGYRWSPDATRLLLTIEDADDPAEAATADDRAANQEGDEGPEPPWVIDRLQFKRDGVGYLTGDSRTHLYVFDLATGALRQLTTGRWDESLGEWSPDGRRIVFASNRTEEPDANANSDLWVVDADAQEPTSEPMRLTDNPGSDGSPTWSPDGRTIAYTTVVRPDLIWYATTHLAVVPAGGGEARVLTAELDRNIGSPRFSDDGQWIWFRLEDSGEDHIARVRPDGSDLQRPVSGALSAGAFDWAGGTFVVSVDSLARPGELYRLDGFSGAGAGRGVGAPRSDGSAAADDDDGGAAGSDGAGPTAAAPRASAAASARSPALTRLTHHNDDFLATVRVAETRNVQFRSEGGVEVEGFVTFPLDYEEGRSYPTLLRIHGGPVSQYSHQYEFESQLFAARGYLVVRTNPRGSSGYGQAFSAALWADWGNPDFKDVMAGVDYAIEQGWADGARLGVGGWSYGGILTNYVITQTDRFEGAITGASEVLYVANYGHDHYQRQWEAELGLPWEDDNREAWERISPFNDVDRITTPTLVMGGEEDWNVPIQNSEQLYQALRRRGVPTRLVVYPGQSHGIRVPSYQVDRYRRYLEWYDRWVKGAPAARPLG